MNKDGYIKFSFLLSGGEEITRVMELKGIDRADLVSISRYSDRYRINIGPHSIDLPASVMKDIVEDILLTYPEDEELQDILTSLNENKPWLFEKRFR